MVLEPKTSEARILVVDDHAISGLYAAEVLRHHTGTVRRTRSASEALKLALEWLPHVICTDFHLPDGDGIALIREIRNQWPVEKPGARVLLMTGDIGQLDTRELEQLHIEHWLQKPVSGAELADLVATRGLNRIEEDLTDRPGPELYSLFKDELEQRISELDQAICQLDRTAVAGILHQLIASAAICREPQLETSLRSLDTRWRANPDSVEIAGLYQSVLECTRHILAGVGAP